MLLSTLFSNPLYLIFFLFAFLLSITIHEYAHAYTAYKYGDPTAKFEGRMSLNPFVHIDPLGLLFILIVGFGWAKPVPVNPHNLNRRSDELKVAFAGILANILIAFLLAVPIRIALINGAAIESSIVLQMLNFFVEINLALAAFNLLPIFPLDGSHLVEYYLDDATRYSYQSMGPYILLGLLLLDRFTGISVISLLMEPILRVLSLLVKGTFTGMI